jgi:hypothetical protein
MTAAPFRRDLIDAEANQRTEALNYAVDKLRQSASALAAASNGEPQALRTAVLVSIQTRMQSMLIELRALA